MPKERGLTFYQVLTLASIVEREAVLDEERPTIAGVYQLRIDGYKGIAPILNSDPTVFYAIDTMELAKLPFDEWQKYAFWAPPGTALKDIDVPEELQGYQTYQTAGLIPGPIATPSLPSIDAALDPNVADGYIYFVAIPDGGGKHDFAKSYTEHQANLEEVRVLMARAGWPDPADFAAPPTAAQRLAWNDADRAARPDRLARVRARFAASDVDAYFDIRPEHMRYLTGFALGDGEEKVAGDSGRFLVSGDEVVLLADSRYTIQAGEEAPDARLFEAYHDLPERWADLVASVGARRVAIEPAFLSHALWGRWRPRHRT